jgi:hypothetical protein
MYCMFHELLHKYCSMDTVDSRVCGEGSIACILFSITFSISVYEVGRLYEYM